MAKRGRQSELDMHPMLKQGRMAVPTVDPLAKMMAASKAVFSMPGRGKENDSGGTQASAPGFSHKAAAVFPHTGMPCSHCGGAMQAGALRMCCSCNDVFCPTCSVANYDLREDRYFCLDCHQHGAGSTVATTTARQCGIAAISSLPCNTPLMTPMHRQQQRGNGFFSPTAFMSGGSQGPSPFGGRPFVSPSIPISLGR